MQTVGFTCFGVQLCIVKVLDNVLDAVDGPIPVQLANQQADLTESRG